ncbi:MAG: phage portal protein, partial [Methyloceanibacter sp.]|uniref:phage portal protein n=1 Tax=Methyloceanibacter sp. TaxID=1965321 RepID=UPI003EE082CE
MLGRALINGVAELRSATLAAPSEWLSDALGASKSIAGPAIDEESALRLAAVGACVRVVSEDIGKVPCIIYERTDAKGSRERAAGDTYAPALGLAPNPEMSAMEYWENLTAYGMLWSHAEAYID